MAAGRLGLGRLAGCGGWGYEGKGLQVGWYVPSGRNIYKAQKERKAGEKFAGNAGYWTRTVDTMDAAAVTLPGFLGAALTEPCSAVCPTPAAAGSVTVAPATSRHSLRVRSRRPYSDTFSVMGQENRYNRPRTAIAVSR